MRSSNDRNINSGSYARRCRGASGRHWVMNSINEHYDLDEKYVPERHALRITIKDIADTSTNNVVYKADAS